MLLKKKCQNYFKLNFSKALFSKIIKNNTIKKPEITRIEDFVKLFKEEFPIQLDKRDIPVVEQKIQCFVPIQTILNKTKILSECKIFLDNLITNNEAGYASLCEETLVTKISLNLDTINYPNYDKDSSIKFKAKFNPDLRKVNFLVNLYNINNYILMGVNPDRKIKKNLKLISFYKDLTLENPLTSTPIKANMIINNELSNKFIPIQNDSFMYMVSQFEFALIPSTKTPLSIGMNIIQELDEINKEFNFPIKKICFKMEAVLQKIPMNKMVTLNSGVSYDPSKMGEYYTNLISEKLDFELKFIDIDGLMNGNEII
jgi:hypothetical protein